MAVFKLNDVERPDGDPFEVEDSRGNTYTLPHPKSLHYDDIMQLDMNNAAAALGVLFGEQADQFLSDPMLDGFALEALFKQYAEHYGLGTVGEGSASSRSSSGTARRSKRTSRSGSATR